MKTKLLITALAFIAFTTVANAQSKGNGKCDGTGHGAAYVDANSNGICNTYENGKTCKKLKKGDGKSNGKNFVDANNNGFCDLRENLK